MRNPVAVGAIALIVAVAPPLRAQNQAYAPNFGTATPIVATGTTVDATYLGWEQTTVFGHEIFALTADQFTTDYDNGCFNFYAQFRTHCVGGTASARISGLFGTDLFGKPYGVTCGVANVITQPCLGAPVTTSFSWTAGTEIIFALLVDQNNGEYNWFFSGDPTRNIDDLAHLATFPAAQDPDGVPIPHGPGDFVPGTSGWSSFGFEDVTYNSSDWDFNNAIFALDGVSVPQATTPEPATMTLLASGLAALGVATRRRRRGVPPKA